MKKGRHIVFAPHLDDEVIGCYSIWDKIDLVVYFTKDYREAIIKDLKKKIDLPPYVFQKDFDFDTITDEDTIYIPSKYDYHPFHKVVRNMALGLKGKKMFYSIEMNVPWLEEEKSPNVKLELLKELYPNEDLFLKNAKYYLFCSIKDFDDITLMEFDISNEKKISIQSFSSDTTGDKVNIKNTVRKLIRDNQAINIQECYRQIQNIFPNRILKLEFNHPYTGVKTIIE